MLFSYLQTAEVKYAVYRESTSFGNTFFEAGGQNSVSFPADVLDSLDDIIKSTGRENERDRDSYRDRNKEFEKMEREREKRVTFA